MTSVIICGGPGSGKTTLLTRILLENPTRFEDDRELDECDVPNALRWFQSIRNNVFRGGKAYIVTVQTGMLYTQIPAWFRDRAILLNAAGWGNKERAVAVPNDGDNNENDEGDVCLHCMRDDIANLKERVHTLELREFVDLEQQQQ